MIESHKSTENEKKAIAENGKKTEKHNSTILKPENGRHEY